MMPSPSAESPDDRNSLYSQSQNNRHKSGDKTSPISVILVSSGSRGNKLLFRYPFQRATECSSSLSGRLCTSMNSDYAYYTRTMAAIGTDLILSPIRHVISPSQGNKQTQDNNRACTYT